MTDQQNPTTTRRMAAVRGVWRQGQWRIRSRMENGSDVTQRALNVISDATTQKTILVINGKHGRIILKEEELVLVYMPYIEYLYFGGR